MITDIYDTNSIYKVYDYLSIANLITKDEAHSIYGSMKDIQGGKLLSLEKEEELRKFFSLYNGLTSV